MLIIAVKNFLPFNLRLNNLVLWIRFQKDFVANELSHYPSSVCSSQKEKNIFLTANNYRYLGPAKCFSVLARVVMEQVNVKHIELLFLAVFQ